MTDTTVEKPVSLTPEIVKSKLQIALTKAEQSIQALHDAESGLVYNEDNLAAIKKFIDSCKSVETVVETERVAMKKPYKEGGEAVDDGAKLVKTELVTLRQKADTQYQKLCKEVAEKERLAEVEKQRVATIRANMDNFKLTYSVKIADAKTSTELTYIEKIINLETGNKNKYQELLPDFVEDCKAIRSLLTGQKEKVRLLEDLEKQQQEASANNDDGAFLEIEEKKEQVLAQVEENKVVIQETASQQAQQAATPVVQIFAKIPSGGRKLCKWKMIDEKAATKAGLTTVIPNKEKIDALLDANRSKISDKESFEENGILYYVDQRF
jgi:hypothetical protein